MVCKKRGKFVGWYRLADQLALNLIAVVRAQKRLLFGGFHSLSHDGQVERSAERDDSVGDRLVFAIIRDLAHKRAINLEGVDRKFLDQ